MVTRKISRLLWVAALGAVLLASSGCTRNPEAFESFKLLNAERAARGVPPLQLDARLVAKAHDWAATMAASGQVRHSTLTAGVGSSWTVLGENVGAAANVTEVNRMFMGSGLHRSVILDRRMTRVGTGVAVVRGKVYVVQVFGG